MRLAIQNHWDPIARRWMIDKGMTCDIGTTAQPEVMYCGVTITDAGEDFCEFEFPDRVRVEAGSIRP